MNLRNHTARLSRVALLAGITLQIAAFASGCSTTRVAKTEATDAAAQVRTPASVPGPGLAQGIDALANASRMSRFEVTQIIEQQVLRNSTTVAAVVGTSTEGAVIASIIRKLEAQNSPLAAALRLNASAKSTAIADLKAVQTQMAASAASGTDVGNTRAGGFGIPTQASDENLRLINRLQGQLKADLLEANSNAMVGARKVPANERALRRIIKTAAQLAQTQGADVLGKMRCVANGDLSDPEAIENLAGILESILGNQSRDLVEAWHQASVARIGRDTRCQLSGNACDVLSSKFAQGCGD